MQLRVWGCFSPHMDLPLATHFVEQRNGATTHECPGRAVRQSHLLGGDQLEFDKVKFGSWSFAYLRAKQKVNMSKSKWSNNIKQPNVCRSQGAPDFNTLPGRSSPRRALRAPSTLPAIASFPRVSRLPGGHPAGDSVSKHQFCLAQPNCSSLVPKATNDSLQGSPSPQSRARGGRCKGPKEAAWLQAGPWEAIYVRKDFIHPIPSIPIPQR